MSFTIKVCILFINCIVFYLSFSHTKIIFSNVTDNVLCSYEQNEFYRYVNQEFIDDKIYYYKKCYEYNDRAPDDVYFKDKDKKIADDHLIIAFVNIVEDEKGRAGKDLTELNYKKYFSLDDIVNKEDIDEHIVNEDNTEQIYRDNLEFELNINKSGVKLNYIDKSDKSILKTEDLKNKKWALFKLDIKDEKVKIELAKTECDLKKSTKYLFVSDINSQIYKKNCFKKRNKEQKEVDKEDKLYGYILSNGLFKNTYNNTIEVIFCDTENVTDINNFFNCTNLETVKNFNLIKTANVKNMIKTFSSSKLKNINLKNLDTHNVKYMGGIFEGIQLENIFFGKNFKTNNVLSICKGFSRTKIKDIDLTKLNFTNVKNIEGLFKLCDNLEKVNMNNMNLTNINSLKEIFACCDKLKEINLKGAKFINIKDITGLFRGCKSIKDIDLSFLKTQDDKSLEIEEMESLFLGCENLENITFGDKFDTYHVKSMNMMFKDCKKLNKLDLTKFNTSNVKSMVGMFLKCNINELILPPNFIPDRCITQWKLNNDADNNEMFQDANISNFYCGDKKLPNNLKNYELFTKFTDKYLEFGDKLLPDGQVPSKCCCTKCITKCSAYKNKSR